MEKTLPDMMSEDEFLEHAGVKGMRWGRRKTDSRNTTRTSADAARVNKIKARVKKNGSDNLSNDDLAKLNKRNQLMSEYKKNNPTPLKKGYKATKDTLAVIATITAVIALGTKVATSPTVQRGAMAVKNAVQNL